MKHLNCWRLNKVINVFKEEKGKYRHKIYKDLELNLVAVAKQANTGELMAIYVEKSAFEGMPDEILTIPAKMFFQKYEPVK